MAVLFVASKDNPYRDNVVALATSLGYSRVYPPIESSELEKVLPALDKKVDLIFVEATGGSESKLVQRSSSAVDEGRRVFDLRDAPSSFPSSSDIHRLIFEQAPMRDAIAYGQTNKAVYSAINWETWRRKVEQHLETKIGLQEFKSSGETPLAAARRANITFGPLRQIPELLKLYQEAEGSRTQREYEDRIRKQIKLWSKKPIDPYVEINFLNSHEKLKETSFYSGWMYGYYATAIANGSQSDDIKGIIRLSLIARKKGPIFKEVELNPSIRGWADTLIWHGLSGVGTFIIREVIHNDPNDPLVDWFIGFAIEMKSTMTLFFLMEELLRVRNDVVSRLLRILPLEEVKQWFRTPEGREIIAGHRWLAERHPDIFEVGFATRPGYSKRVQRVVVR